MLPLRSFAFSFAVVYSCPQVEDFQMDEECKLNTNSINTGYRVLDLVAVNNYCQSGLLIHNSSSQQSSGFCAIQSLLSLPT